MFGGITYRSALMEDFSAVLPMSGKISEVLGATVFEISPSFSTVVYGIIEVWFLTRSALIYGGPGHSVILIAVAHRKKEINST
jgi:hypothetical protein